MNEAIPAPAHYQSAAAPRDQQAAPFPARPPSMTRAACAPERLNAVTDGPKT
jgi:hypothetical protein